MHESFFTIATVATATTKEKGSKFIAFAHPVTDTGQIKSILDGLRKEYFDARHHCYAWVLGADKKQFRAYDDGEPNHTAGDPILGQIHSKHLTNVLVVVIRYFGGTKLGVSGLISAYRNTAAEVLLNSTIIEKTITASIHLAYDYSATAIVMALMKEFKAKVVDERFGESCSKTFSIPIGQLPRFNTKLTTLQAMGHAIFITQ